MGREKKILLTMLCLLSGTFVGVLSAKLLVPRPPIGAGPDIHADTVVAAGHELVEPPALSARPPAAFEPAADAVAMMPPADATEPVAESAESFAAPPPAAQSDPPVTQAAFDEPVVTGESVGARDPAGDAVSDSGLPAAAASPVPVGVYVTVAGDSWWSLAERVYGDGRLYRALFAWNRSIDPRVSLVPGTRLDLPQRQRLEAATPRLVPDP